MTNCWLMLPGVPVLAHLAEIVNGTGTVLRQEPLECEYFLRPAADLSACWFSVRDNTGGERLYRAGGVQQSVFSHNGAVFGATCRDDLLQLAADPRDGLHEPDSSRNYLGWWKRLCVTAPAGETALTDPVFVLAGKHAVASEALEDLLRLRFTRLPD